MTEIRERKIMSKTLYKYIEVFMLIKLYWFYLQQVVVFRRITRGGGGKYSPILKIEIKS